MTDDHDMRRRDSDPLASGLTILILVLCLIGLFLAVLLTALDDLANLIGTV